MRTHHHKWDCKQFPIKYAGLGEHFRSHVRPTSGYRLCVRLGSQLLLSNT
jgi:hypothetical protein